MDAPVHVLTARGIWQSVIWENSGGESNITGLLNLGLWQTNEVD